ncbi:fumarylacetoacetate hydrolase family protein [Alkalihalobacillus oceani]|uniref:fumarylacetoacetate hydrolase family protein n=1 Tax=Halalkalibacter oceani TaxID=1653776 RepID=UPI00203E6A00|nr:fumarylacetoacetate hydrolase family protein [Halalkalibacter oceani]MCM3762160.1 fumarylacetoacetate hydrolase family protein [Halalkalibacter oceani]
MNVGNIYCIGRNYVKHAEELGNAVPEEPLLFSKPTHALVQADGREIILPQDKGEIHHELEIVLQMKREVKAGDRVADVVGAMALGVDLTLRDVQSALKKKGHPWLRAKGFKQSAIVGPFWEFTSVEDCKQVDFSLVKNGEVVQKGNISHMIFDFQTIIDECADCFGLGEGDLIYTGTPEGVGPLTSGDAYQLFWGEDEKGSFRVR